MNSILFIGFKSDFIYLKYIFKCLRFSLFTRVFNCLQQRSGRVTQSVLRNRTSLIELVTGPICGRCLSLQRDSVLDQTPQPRVPERVLQRWNTETKKASHYTPICEKKEGSERNPLFYLLNASNNFSAPVALPCFTFSEALLNVQQSAF